MSNICKAYINIIGIYSKIFGNSGKGGSEFLFHITNIICTKKRPSVCKIIMFVNITSIESVNIFSNNKLLNSLHKFDKIQKIVLSFWFSLIPQYSLYGQYYWTEKPGYIGRSHQSWFVGTVVGVLSYNSGHTSINLKKTQPAALMVMKTTWVTV